ncbi:Hpt domain-containing protein [uncultured Cohaesibacter sp.]|uniref:Hpt domain-containing protein n=1 Tax=uncultured Cohaesibacter sp. TaxID=1002546 RepID=UPI0029C8CA47|nr:Hpt domain-containing protein [uncultured Cohaesibacter sp.]
MTGQPDGTVIDLQHLERQTMGDGGLQAEVLKIFIDQMGEKAQGLDGSRPDLRDFAHGIKGSARGIGAVGVASAAERLERGEGDIPALIEDLRHEIGTAVAEAERLLANMKAT